MGIDGAIQIINQSRDLTTNSVGFWQWRDADGKPCLSLR